MRITASLFRGCIVLLLLVACLQWQAVEPAAGESANSARVASRTNTRTKTRTKTRTPTKTLTKSRTVTRTATKKPATVSATAIVTETNSASPSVTLTVTKPVPSTDTPTSVSTVPPTPEASVSLTPTKAVTNTVSNTDTPTRTATYTLPPTHTPSATPTRTHTASPTPNPDRARNTILNGGFEALGGWNANSSFLITTGIGSVSPRSGSYMMATNGPMFEIYQSVTVPSSAPYLRFSYRVVGSSNGCGSFTDSIYVYSSNGLMSDTLIDVCNTAGWMTGTLDLSSDGGNTNEIIIEVSTAGGGTVFFDDIGFVSEPTRDVDYY